MSSAPTPAVTADVVILGTGLGGSMLGAILARHGARVALLDPESHPRFAHGEVPTPRSMVALRTVAERYGVSELKTLASCGASRTGTNPCRSPRSTTAAGSSARPSASSGTGASCGTAPVSGRTRGR